MDDEAIEDMLREARVPEFVWDISLRSAGHNTLADRLDNEQYGGGTCVIYTGPEMRIHDTIWYLIAKHLVLQDRAIEFLSLKDVINIAIGESADTDAEHVFIEGFVYAERQMPLTPAEEHAVKEQLRYWIMREVCVYPYVRGNMASVQAWWGEDFTNYLDEMLTEYYYNP